MGLIIGFLVLIGALVVGMVLLGVAIKLSVLALKVLLFLMLLSWLARVVFGWRRPRRRTGSQLVGQPVVDVPAPRAKDKYEVAAERELDKELGF